MSIMRDDLLDAQAAIDWAVAQIPVLEERLTAYDGRRPYVIDMEPDPKGTGDLLMTFHSLGAPDAIINAEAGAIINSIRSSLDLLFVAIIGRNGMKFSRDAHFPIRRKATDFLKELKALKTKQWLTQSQATAIKNLRPYRRGNRSLYLLNQFDILRKHRRLIEVRPRPGSLHVPMYIGGSRAEWRHLKNKSVMLRCPPGTTFCPAKADCKVTIQVVFYEPSLGVKYAPLGAALRHLADVAQGIVTLFA
jgi:hypothetical protein